VPDAVMVAMRASPCISLTLSRPNRVRLLTQDYGHFVADPSALNAQLEHLVLLHGRAKIAAWQALANAGEMAQVVDELLVEHYDPAYLKSIDRNFAQFHDARVVELPDIGEADFMQAARQLHPA
jgi:tRNA 2-selenouridine synthase